MHRRTVFTLLFAVAVLIATALFVLSPLGRAPPPRPPVDVGAAPSPPVAELPSLPPPIDLGRCDRDNDLFGTVKAPDGRPVAGARIATESRPWGEFVLSPFDVALRDEVAAGPATSSSRDGTFRLPLARGQVVDLLVSAEGYHDEILKARLAGERVDIVLRPLGTTCAAGTRIAAGSRRRPPGSPGHSGAGS